MKFKFLIVFFIILLYNKIGNAQGTIPNSQAGEIFKSWLDCYNSGDTSQLNVFIQKYYPKRMIEDNIFSAKEWKDYLKIFGKLQLYNYDSTYKDKNGIHWQINALLCNYQQSKWLRVKMIVCSGGKKICGIGINNARKPKEIKIKRLTDDKLFSELNQYISKLVGKEEFAGVVIIAKNGVPVFNKSYGYANRELKLLHNSESVFYIASLGKMFTSTAIGQLVQAGKLSYNDTLIKVLPNYPNKEVASKITIHHLLNHSSGMGDVYTSEYFEKTDPMNLKNIDDWFPMFVNYPLEFEPGTDIKYSNAGYIVLGAVIERLSGLSYYTYMEESIFNPSKMNHTKFYTINDTIPNLAVQYTHFPSGPERSDSIFIFKTKNFRGSSHGGAYSTAGDLVNFAQSLRQYKLCNKKITHLMIEKKVEIGEGIDDYGYGFQINTTDNIRTIGHGGGVPGISNVVGIYWDSDYDVIILSNADSPVADDIATFVHERIKAN